MNWREHITADPAVLVGKPVLRGTRLAVEFILGLIAQGWPEQEITGMWVVKRIFFIHDIFLFLYSGVLG